MKNLEKNSQTGVYYWRSQVHGKNKRKSLGTKSAAQAKNLARILNFKLAVQKLMADENLNINNVSTWSIKKDPVSGEISITTENNDADRASALLALEILSRQPAEATKKSEPIPPHHQNSIEIYKAVTVFGAGELQFKNLTEKTKKQTLSTINTFIDYCGGINLKTHDLNNQIAKERWFNRRLKEVERATVKREMSQINTFIGWGNRNGYFTFKFDFKVEAVEYKSYKHFTKEDLDKITNGLANLRIAHDEWAFWLILLGMFTGARLGQFFTIETDDIQQKSGHWVIHFKSKNKNKASIREIPIPRQLIAVGFLDFIEKRKRQGKVKLLEKYPNKGSVFFTAYKRSLGIVDDAKCFHSFRTTLVDCLKQNGVQFAERCQFIGHDEGGGTHNKTYARNDFGIQHMAKNCTNKIDFKKYVGFELPTEKLKEIAKNFR